MLSGLGEEVIMPDDDLGYLLRRSIDERDMADKAEDSTARAAHGQLADRYAARVQEQLDRLRELHPQTSG
jgi:hypothetical protein